MNIKKLAPNAIPQNLQIPLWKTTSMCTRIQALAATTCGLTVSSDSVGVQVLDLPVKLLC